MNSYANTLCIQHVHNRWTQTLISHTKQSSQTLFLSVCVQSTLKRSVHSEKNWDLVNFFGDLCSHSVFLEIVLWFWCHLLFFRNNWDNSLKNTNKNWSFISLSLLLNENINSFSSPFSVLCIKALRNNVCEHCSVRYITVCVHVHKYFNRNKLFVALVVVNMFGFFNYAIQYSI